jgi:hypothetical protein
MPKLSLLKTKEEKTFGDHLRNFTLELLAVVAWIYTLLKVFLFDIDTWIVGKYFPDLMWVLNFKLISILAVAALTWLWVGTRDFIVWFLYITFYPLVLLLIRLPIFVYKQRSWVLAFSVLNLLVAFFKNLKFRLIFVTVFLAAFATALFASGSYVTPLTAGVLVILALAAFARGFWTAVQPSAIFQLYSKFFRGVRNFGGFSFALDEELKTLPREQLAPKQLERWNTNLQSSVLFNRFCLFAATRLRDYQKSEWRIIPSIFGLLGLIAFSVLCFSAVNYALYKWNSDLFSITQEPTYFIFVYYSFNILIFNSTTELSATMPLSQAVYMLQASLSFFAVVILATLYIANRAQRTSSELDKAISELEVEADSMESFIQSEFKLTNVVAAMEHLRDAKFGLIQLIYWLTKSINRE